MKFSSDSFPEINYRPFHKFRCLPASSIQIQIELRSRQEGRAEVGEFYRRIYVAWSPVKLCAEYSLCHV